MKTESVSGALMVGHVLFDFERHRILKDFQQLCKLSYIHRYIDIHGEKLSCYICSGVAADLKIRKLR